MPRELIPVFGRFDSCARLLNGYILIQLVLWKMTGNETLDDLLKNKEELSENILVNLRTDFEQLGIRLLQLGIRDLIFAGCGSDLNIRLM